MNRSKIIGLALLSATACTLPTPELNELSSFEVTTLGVFQKNGTVRAPLPVVGYCQIAFADGGVPAEIKGTAICPYVIPRGEIEIDIKAVAKTIRGDSALGFNGPVAFRVIPGDVSGTLVERWATVKSGEVTATVKGLHQYGKTRVWVEDAPPRPVYDGGVVVGSATELPVEPAKRTYAAGTSPIIYFAEHTLQSIQLPDDLDNRSSPFVNEFVSIGKNPESGELLLQSCLEDPERNGKPVQLVITGLDPSGFFVSDLTACRLKERIKDNGGATRVRTSEIPEACEISLSDGGVAPSETTDGGTGKCAISKKNCSNRNQCDSYSPSTFAHMFIYNFNFPEGLDEGDLIYTLSGSVQEFTSTTQMVFPAWTVAERVRQLPPSQWNKYLNLIPPVVVGGRQCGWDNTAAPFLTDSLCGQNRRVLKLESLESGLVKLRRVKFPKTFANCDKNGNGQVPFFCESTDIDGNWFWASCAFNETEPEADRVERECNQNCVVGMGEYAQSICAEETTFKGFGQFPVEMAPAGLAQFNLDDSLPARFTVMKVMHQEFCDGGGCGMVVRDAGFDSGIPDAGMPDSGVPDAGTIDGSIPDAGAVDAGDTDAGDLDGSIDDGGFEDAGMDAGFDAGFDAGRPDAGRPDAGRDAGPLPPVLIDGGAPQRFAVNGYGPGSEVAIACDRDTNYRISASNDFKFVGPTDTVLKANEVKMYRMAANESLISFGLGEGALPATCSVGLNSRGRINLITKDALVTIEPNCSESDPDAEKAKRCKQLRGATFDVVGHIKQVQPGRPRWLVTPRAQDDVCCYPGPGLDCPAPIKKCVP
jgi:hypothetical protein